LQLIRPAVPTPSLGISPISPIIGALQQRQICDWFSV
jgi:hypothetical protein